MLLGMVVFGAAARRRLRRPAAAVAARSKPGSHLRGAVFAGVRNLRPEAAPALLTAALLTNEMCCAAQGGCD